MYVFKSMLITFEPAVSAFAGLCGDSRNAPMHFLSSGKIDGNSVAEPL